MIKKQNIQKQVTEATANGSIAIAEGHTKIRFTGDSNPRTQVNLYLASLICGTTILNYTPSPELVREADAMMDREYKKLVVANRQRVKGAVAMRATAPPVNRRRTASLYEQG